MPINWRLLGQPLNWLIVFLMLLVAAFFFQLIGNWLETITSGATGE